MSEFKQAQPYPTGDNSIKLIGGVRNVAATSKSATDGDVIPLATDGSGALLQSASSPGLKAEDAAAASGDVGCVELIRRTDTAAVQTDTDGDYTVPVGNSFGVQHSNIDSGFQKAAATGLLKLEDAAANSGDAGVAMLMKRTDTLAAQTDTDGDYTLPTANSLGAPYINLDSDAQKSVPKGLLKLANSTSFNANDAGIVIFGARNNSQATAFAGADLRYGPMQIDTTGRVIMVPNQNAIAVVVTPTVSTTPAYTAQDAVGGKQTIASATSTASGKAKLKNISLIDKGNQKAALTIVFFNGDPSAATITDNAAFVWSTDNAKFIGTVNIAAADYTTVGSQAVASKLNLDFLFQLNAVTSLYAAVITTGTPTYVSTTDLIFTYGIERLDS